MRLTLAGIAVLGLWLATLPLSAQTPAQPIDGKAAFRHHCGKCHLENGTGTFMLGRRLGKENALLEGRKGIPAAYVRQIVRHGIFSMPRFTRIELSDRELDAIAGYLGE